MREDEHSKEFEQELDKMLEAPDQSWFGTEARLDLWRKLDVECRVGPIQFEQMSESQGVINFDECDFRIGLDPFCRML